jgi:adenylate cyclase
MKPGTKRALVVLGICAVCTLLFGLLWRNAFPPLRQFELYAQDFRARESRKTPFDDRLVLIGIDKLVYDPADFSPEEYKQEPSLALLQQNFPWSREVWARLVQKLGDAGAKVIVFDLVFAAPGQGDADLKQALEKYSDRVVIGYNINWTKTDQRSFVELQLPNPDVFDAHGTNSPVEDIHLGYVNVFPDADGVLRRAHYRQTGHQIKDILPPEIVLESLDSRVLRAFGRPDLIPAGFEGMRFRYTGPPNTFKPLRIGDVLSPKIWAANFHNGADFKDKIVFIGPTTVLFHDVLDTPFAKDVMPGPEIHLNIINAALHKEFVDEPSLIAELWVIVLAGIIAMAIASIFRQPLKRLLVLLILAVAYFELSRLLFSRASTSAEFLITTTPILVLLLSGVMALAYDYLVELLEKRRVRRTLERYVSKDVVKEVLDNPGSFLNSLGGVRKSVTVLFSDIRGFTTLTESADSSALVKQLNEYFQEMVGAVFAHRGTLDKFIGDAVMAVWGNIDISDQNQKDGALRAVATALAMKRSLRTLNEDWKKRGMLELHFGIGINHGEVIVGNLGCQEKMDPTVIGDAVNLASRLEGLTKEYHLDLLLGEQMASFVGGTYILRTVDFVAVKGKTKPVDVFTVMGDGAAQTVSMPVWLARYEDGVRLYRERKFSEAATEFQECLRKQPDDYLSSMYLKRCQALIESPPDDSWNGVFVMTKK